MARNTRRKTMAAASEATLPRADEELADESPLPQPVPQKSRERKPRGSTARSRTRRSAEEITPADTRTEVVPPLAAGDDSLESLRRALGEMRGLVESLLRAVGDVQQQLQHLREPSPETAGYLEAIRGEVRALRESLTDTERPQESPPPVVEAMAQEVREGLAELRQAHEVL